MAKNVSQSLRKSTNYTWMAIRRFWTLWVHFLPNLYLFLLPRGHYKKREKTFHGGLNELCLQVWSVWWTMKMSPIGWTRHIYSISSHLCNQKTEFKKIKHTRKIANLSLLLVFQNLGLAPLFSDSFENFRWIWNIRTATLTQFKLIERQLRKQLFLKLIFCRLQKLKFLIVIKVEWVAHGDMSVMAT